MKDLQKLNSHCDALVKDAKSRGMDIAIVAIDNNASDAIKAGDDPYNYPVLLRVEGDEDNIVNAFIAINETLDGQTVEQIQSSFTPSRMETEDLQHMADKCETLVSDAKSDDVGIAVFVIENKASAAIKAGDHNWGPIYWRFAGHMPTLRGAFLTSQIEIDRLKAVRQSFTNYSIN